MPLDIELQKINMINFMLFDIRIQPYEANGLFSRE